MPVFDFCFESAPPGVQAGGSSPFPLGLQQAGPLVPVQVGIATRVAGLLQKANVAVPAPSTGLALIDTGASVSGVDKRVVSALGLLPIGVQKVFTAKGADQQSVYAAKFSFPGTNLPGIEFGQLLGVDLADQRIQLVGNQPLIAILGREILSKFIMIYHGPRGQYTLAF